MKSRISLLSSTKRMIGFLSCCHTLDRLCRDRAMSSIPPSMMNESAFMVDRRTVKQVPFPLTEDTDIFPLCISTISLVR